MLCFDDFPKCRWESNVALAKLTSCEFEVMLGMCQRHLQKSVLCTIKELSEMSHDKSL